MIVIIGTNAAANYFHVVVADGTYGVIELVDGQYRAEFYDDKITGHSINGDIWQESPMYHVGSFDSLKDAVWGILSEIEFPTKYLQKRINREGSIRINDWLLEYKELNEEHIDGFIQDCLKNLPHLPLRAYAKESRMEAEFFELHPDDETDSNNADVCYERADYFYELADVMDDIKQTA